MVELQAALYAAADTVPLWRVPVVMLLMGALLIALLIAYDQYSGD